MHRGRARVRSCVRSAHHEARGHQTRPWSVRAHPMQPRSCTLEGNSARLYQNGPHAELVRTAPKLPKETLCPHVSFPQTGVQDLANRAALRRPSRGSVGVMHAMHTSAAQSRTKSSKWKCRFLQHPYGRGCPHPTLSQRVAGGDSPNLRFCTILPRPSDAGCDLRGVAATRNARTGGPQLRSRLGSLPPVLHFIQRQLYLAVGIPT